MTRRPVELTIENAAPHGPAHTITVEGRTYTVESCRMTDDGLTETYDLTTEDEAPANITVNVTGSVLNERDLLGAVQRATRWGRS